MLFDEGLTVISPVSVDLEVDFSMVRATIEGNPTRRVLACTCGNEYENISVENRDGWFTITIEE